MPVSIVAMSERYEIRGKLGKGGMSAVYRAFDSVMGREVAIKRLLPLEETNLNEDAGDVLASEAAALARFQHPNIVTVYAFETDSDGPYVVMELVDGEDLHHVLQAGALSLEDFLDIAVQCLEPLVSASELNLMHRDIKPGNIMLTMTPSERFLVKILDFGLAKFSQQPSTQTLDQAGSFLGSIDYIAPEQLELMPLDQRTDLYSLGCVFYYALAQRAPFTGDNPAETTMNHLNHAVIPLASLRPDIPKPIADWLMRMISRDPNARPRNALEALEQFRLAEEGQGTEPAPDALTEEVTSSFTSVEAATGDVLPPGDIPPAPASEPVKRPVLNTSPQIPRPNREVKRKAELPNAATPFVLADGLRNPFILAAGGLVLLGLLFYHLFGGSSEVEEKVSVPDASELVKSAVKSEAALGKEKFEIPNVLKLNGPAKSLAVLPADPSYVQRFATAEGMMKSDFSPVSADAEPITAWINLKTRSRRQSLFPLGNDEFAEFTPVSKILTDQQVPALKFPVTAAGLNARSSLVLRAGLLNLEKGFTLFFVGKIDPGSGRQVRVESSSKSGEMAGLKIDFSGNVVGSTRVGASMQESSLKVPWDDSNVGVIAYGSSPEVGRHHLAALPVSATEVSFERGNYARAPSSFQRLFIGQNDQTAEPDGDYATWIFEMVLYDRLLTAEEIKDTARRLSEFYFK